MVFRSSQAPSHRLRAARRRRLQRARAPIPPLAGSYSGRRGPDAVAHRRRPGGMTTTAKTTLPARYYTDHSLFAREQERFYADMWVAVGREHDIAAPGEYVVREVAGESVIVTRDDKGGLQAF